MNTVSSCTVLDSSANPSQSKYICDFLQCEQITTITPGEIIIVLSVCNHLLSKKKSFCLAVYCNHHSSVSVTAAFDN